MFDLSLGSLIAYAVFFVLGAFLGVLLARRSKTANNVVTATQAEWDEWKREFEEWKAGKTK